LHFLTEEIHRRGVMLSIKYKIFCFSVLGTDSADSTNEISPEVQLGFKFQQNCRPGIHCTASQNVIPYTQQKVLTFQLFFFFWGGASSKS
jgi:hypothetical protein